MENITKENLLKEYELTYKLAQKGIDDIRKEKESQNPIIIIKYGTL